MSAEEELSDLLNHAINNSATLAAAASEMTQAAVAVLEDAVRWTEPPSIPNSYGLPFAVTPLPQKKEPAIGFPVWPIVEFGDPPDVSAIDFVDADSSDYPTFPTLSLPSFTYPNLVSPLPWTQEPPAVDTAIHFPVPPVTDSSFSPARLALDALSSPTLTVASPAFMPVNVDVSLDDDVFSKAFSEFTSSIFNGHGGLTGLDELLVELGDWSNRILDALLPEVLVIFQQRFTEKYAPVLSFHTQLMERLSERLTTENDRVLNTVTTHRSGWDLPTAVQLALMATAQQVATAWRQQAQGQADIKTAELSLQFFESCGNLFAAFNNGIQALKTKELEYTLDAHRLAIAYAKQVIKALLAEYESTNFTLKDLQFQKAEARLKVFEAELRVAMLHYEMSKDQLQAEEAKQDNDAALVKNHRTDVENASQNVQIYAEQVSAARSELELQKLPFDLFALQVKQFDAQINAHQATMNMRIGEMVGDSAQIEGELMKVKAFEAEVRGFEKEIATQLAVLNAQSDRNDAVIREFEMQVKAALAPIEQSLLTNQYELKKYQIIAADALSDATLALDEARTQEKFNDRQHSGLMESYQITQRQRLELMKAELDRLKAISDANNQGAKIMAEMAHGAMSVANGIANVIFSESA